MLSSGQGGKVHERLSRQFVGRVAFAGTKNVTITFVKRPGMPGLKRGASINAKGGDVMKTVTIQVKGMHCGSCEALVKEALEELRGVEDVDVSHSSGTATVSYHESTISLEDLNAAIEKEGYTVSG